MARGGTTPDRGMRAAIAVGGVAATVVLVRWLRTRNGQRRYREFVARMEHAAELAQQRAREAQHLIQDRTDEFAAAVKSAAGEAQETLQRLR